jgi:hypothetical protein
MQGLQEAIAGKVAIDQAVATASAEAIKTTSKRRGTGRLTARIRKQLPRADPEPTSMLLMTLRPTLIEIKT